MSASAPRTCEQHHYGICYNTDTGLFYTVKNPQHPNYPGYVYGTVRAHADADSAIGEYRELVQRKGIFENAEASAVSALERIPKLLACAMELQRSCGSLSQRE